MRDLYLNMASHKQKNIDNGAIILTNFFEKQKSINAPTVRQRLKINMWTKVKVNNSIHA